MTKRKPAAEHKPKGRKPTRVVKIDATPEQAARAFFSAVKPPDPTRRTGRTKAATRPTG